MQIDVFEQMKEHLKVRSDILLEHVEQQFDVQRTKVKIEITGDGKVKVNSLSIEASKNLIYFSGVEIRLEAIAEDGYEFAGWNGAVRSEQTVIYVDPAEVGRIKAKFIKEGSGRDLLEDGLEERTSISVP